MSEFVQALLADECAPSDEWTFGGSTVDACAIEYRGDLSDGRDWQTRRSVGSRKEIWTIHVSVVQWTHTG